MPIVSLKQVQMYYEISGKGPHLVLVGGLCNDHSLWTPLIPFLSSHFTVITFDNRGTGQTIYPPSPFTVEDMAADILSLLDHLQVKKAFLLGYSLGGAIAQVLASQSSRFEKAIFIATTTSFSLVCRMTAHFQYLLRKNVTDTHILALGLLPWLFSSRILATPEAVQKIVEKLYGNLDAKGFDGYARQLQALEDFQGQKIAASIRQPCLVIGADEDILILPKHVQLLQKTIPHSTFHMISNAAHMVIFEQAPQVCEQIVSFFK